MIFTPIKPMLLSMGQADAIYNDDRWLYDIKWDGWRILIHKKSDKIEAYTREGNLVTHKFPELNEVFHQIKSQEAIIDCEGVVLRDGNSAFEDFAYRGLLNSPEKVLKAMQTHPVTFVAFDVLATTESHLNEPLVERKKRLADLIQPSDVLVTSPYVIGEGESLYELTKKRGMEGIVEKRIDAPYQLNKRSKDWIKHKHFKQMDTVILGYKENPFALIVGTHFDHGLKPVATVEFGFKPEEKLAFRKIASQIISKEAKGVKWLEPILCGTVQYLEKTEKEHLRIVSFKGFKPEKSPNECQWR